jgi:alkanesulfonate monooxygenase SsuD/methylene tetrahydromethanopterin reductase-like flavin-dependent oxidoreductase (luciferase family)
MKFGVMELFQHPRGKSARDVIHDAIEMAVQAEELGFDSIWLAEHHFSTYGLVGSPLMMAAAIAQRTSRIRIGTAVLVLPLYNPVRLAEEIALVDQMSMGRLDVGIGRGYLPSEFRGFAVNPEHTREIADEIVEILRQAWTRDAIDFEGAHHRIHDVAVLPKPFQQPHPPIHQAAVSMTSFEAAGASGSAILTSPNFTPIETVQKQFALYQSALRLAGYDPADYDLPLMQQVYVGSDRVQARTAPREAAMWYHAMLAARVPGADGEAPKGYEQWNRIAENMKSIRYEDIVDRGANFGSSEEVAAKIAELRDVTGVNHYLSWFTFGGLDKEVAAESMKRFADEVMPVLR